MSLRPAAFFGRIVLPVVPDAVQVTTPQCDVCPTSGVIGFDIGQSSRGSGSRMQSYLVNALCKPIGANSKRTDFALAA